MEGVRGGSTSRLIRVSHICRREVEQHQEEFGDTMADHDEHSICYAR